MIYCNLTVFEFNQDCLIGIPSIINKRRLWSNTLHLQNIEWCVFIRVMIDVLLFF